MTRLFIICFSIIAVSALRAEAKAVQSDASVDRSAPITAPNTPSTLVATANQMIAAFDQKLGLHKPLNNSHAISVATIQDRIAKLSEAHKYAQSIVEGLAAAASASPDSDVQHELTALGEAHDRQIFSAFADLLATDIVADTGWFLISEFGRTTEQQAGKLLAAATSNRALLFGIISRLETLTRTGEASDQSLRIATEQLSTIPSTQSLSSEAAG